MWHTGYQEGVWNEAAAKAEVAAGGSNLNYDGNTNIDILRTRRIAMRTVQSLMFGSDTSALGVVPVEIDSRPAQAQRGSAGRAAST
jgi:hypothetical protein